MAEYLSKKINAPYIETSTQTGQNVKVVFQKMAEMVYLSKQDYR